MNNKKKAVFLDRDGVINKKKDGYVKSLDEFEIFKGVGEAIKKLKNFGFLVIVVSNQSAVNRGYTTHEKMVEIHDILQKYLNNFGAGIDGIYYCPHRPDEDCECRKPKVGLFLKAIKDMNIDPKNSWMIGDQDSDIKAGENVGCKCIKIEKEDGLLEKVEFILKKSIKQ